MDMGLSGLEPPTSRLSGVRSNQLSYKPIFFFQNKMGLNGLEPSTSRLSGVRSNQLSYNPIFNYNLAATCFPIPSPV